jgi:putative alpha-1,2-mannosidase
VLDTPSTSQQVWTAAGLARTLSAHVDIDEPLGASFNLAAHAGQVVNAKIGISFISTAQARANIAEEVPAWNFAAVHAASVEQWNEAFSAIELRGVTSVKRKQVYTAIYHTMLMPADRTGENPDWPTSYPEHPYYDDYYAIWDTYRSSAPRARPDSFTDRHLQAHRLHARCPQRQR